MFLSKLLILDVNDDEYDEQEEDNDYYGDETKSDNDVAKDGVTSVILLMSWK